MINYQVHHQLMNNLKAIVQVLGKNKQSFFTAVELTELQNQLNQCKPIAPKSPKNENKKIVEGEVVLTEVKKNDKK